MSSSEKLKELEENVKSDLAVLDYPARSGIVEYPDPEVANVLIVGGGQSGLGIAGGLKLEKVPAVRVLEERADGLAGPWRNFARMHTLRTPKNLPGPNWGIPNLSFRRWFEATRDSEGWNDLSFIDKEDWAAYLDWYRDVMEIEVEYDSKVVAIERDEERDLMKVRVSRLASGSEEIIYARRVVLATGIEGSGAWSTPAFISENLPKEVWAHTSEEIDFDALKGKKIGVLGAGASAFDNASVCLETGSASVDLCFRRKELVRINTFRWVEYMEFLKHFPDLDDARKWRFMWKIVDIGQLPPHNTYHRALKHDNFTMRSGTPWDSVEYKDGKVLVHSGDQVFEYDYIIVATGFRTDLDVRPELSSLSGKIKRWADVFTPDPAYASDELGQHPYLGENFQFLSRDESKWVSNIFNYTYGAMLTNGFSGASITGMKYSLSRVVKGLTASFFEDDKDYHYQTLCEYDVQEF